MGSAGNVPRFRPSTSQTQVPDSEHWSIVRQCCAVRPRPLGRSVFLHQWARTHQRSTPGDRGGSLDLVDLVSGWPKPGAAAADSLRRHPRRSLRAAPRRLERAIAQYSYLGRYQETPGEVQPTTPRGGGVGELRQALELRAGSRKQSRTADRSLAAGRPRSPADLQRQQGSALHRNRNPGAPSGTAAGGGDRTTGQVDRIIEASKSLGAAPYIGVRAKLSSRSTGRWGSSVGDKAKFGLSSPSCWPQWSGCGRTT